MSDNMLCSKCEHYRIEYRFRNDIEENTPEQISICDLHHTIVFDIQPECKCTDFSLKEIKEK